MASWEGRFWGTHEAHDRVMGWGSAASVSCGLAIGVSPFAVGVMVWVFGILRTKLLSYLLTLRFNLTSPPVVTTLSSR